MKNSKVILLNGPPGSGKDTAANHLSHWLPGGPLTYPCLRKFATHVKEGTHALLGLFDGGGRPLRFDYFENEKDERLDLFYGMTPRQAYIWFSEEVMKPKFGTRVFGEIEARKIEDDRVYIFSDSGFVDEALEVVNVVGPENVLLVNLHRHGHTYAGDSRSYLTAEQIGLSSQNHRSVFNDGGQRFFDDVLQVCGTWLELKNLP